LAYQEVHVMRVLDGVKQEITTMAFSADGTKLAVGGSAARAHIWDLDGERATSVLGRGGPFVRIDFRRDHLVGVVNGGEIRIRDLASGREKKCLTRGLFLTHAVLAPRQGTVIVTGGESTWRYGLRAWTLPDLEPAWDYWCPKGEQDPYSLAVSSDGATLAVGGSAGVHLHDPKSGTPRSHLASTSSNVRRLTFSADGRWVAAAIENHLLVWTAAGVQCTDVSGGRKHFMAMAFSPDGRFLAAASTDQTVRLFHTSTWQEAIVYNWDIGPVREVLFSPDGMRAAAGGATGRIVVWDVDL
jgi:WD40 repeat protein